MGELSAAPRIKLKAKSAILINDSNGKVLYTKNPDRPMQPASLTKILSLYLVHEAISSGENSSHGHGENKCECPDYRGIEHVPCR